jgi:hypothetical protein
MRLDNYIRIRSTTMRPLDRRFLVPSIALGVLVLCSPPALAGKTGLENLPQIPPVWNLRFQSPVEWQRVGPLGHLLIKTSTALNGVDPVKGKVIWSHGDLGSLAEDHFEEIPGTPLVTLSDGLARPRILILNSVDGRLVFDSKKSGVAQVLSKHILPRNRSLLLMGFRQGKPATTMFMIDVVTGKLLWENDQLLGKAGKFTKFMTALVQAATNMSGIVAEPLEISRGSFLMAAVNDVYRINSRTGSIEWQFQNASGARKTRFFRTKRTPGVVYVGSETSTQSSNGEYVYTYYSAHRLSDGKEIWSKPVKLKGWLNDVIFTSKGLIVSPRTMAKGKIKLVDYASGRSLWGKKGKGIEVLGGIVDYDRTKAGIVLTTGYDSAWTDKGPQYFLNILDVDAGSLRFKKPLKVKGRILSTDVLPRGILFVTTSEVNMLDPTTGREIFKSSIRSDESLITATTARHLYAFSTEDGLLYRLDKSAGTLQALSKKRVKLEEDEVPMSLEVTKGQITVVSSQNVVAYTRDGTLRFHAYHPSPRRPALMRALLRAQQIRAGMAAVVSGAASGAFVHAATHQDPGSMDRTITAGIAEGYGTMAQDLASLSSQYGEAARARFKASAVSTDFVFMMVKRARGSYGLAKVSKKTGRIDGIINLGRDKKPSYQVDGVANTIFYRPSSTAVVGYRF